ncbi:hypothetical protein [Klebsiella grimontii]|uniref:hypothetical protein n=1 Tax=Klebsiella grimontii TaxID=2058152 RepID=UPI0012B6E0E5|nr:hypothetical protein [Klebsiella grimontii]
MFKHLTINITLQGEENRVTALDDLVRSEEVAGRVAELIGHGYREGSFALSNPDYPMSVAWNCTTTENY